MSAPLTTLREAHQRRRTRRGLRHLFSKPTVWEIQASNAHPAETTRHRADDLAEWLLSSRGRENLALTLIAMGSLVGIYVCARYG